MRVRADVAGIGDGDGEAGLGRSRIVDACHHTR